jgi:hypothetical protein
MGTILHEEGLIPLKITSRIPISNTQRIESIRI